MFEYDDRDAASLLPALKDFFAGDAIVIKRKTKRGEGESDIRPSIREIHFSLKENDVLLEAVISAQEPTLKPELLADALRQLAHALAPDFAKITRLETYDTDMRVFR